MVTGNDEWGVLSLSLVSWVSHRPALLLIIYLDPQVAELF